VVSPLRSAASALRKKCEVKDTSGNVISGLFAAGEITGGSFFNNYPGGSGLMKGAVFGRLAGTQAVEFAKANRT
jgi:tricarballylate dehydrogenase